MYNHGLVIGKFYPLHFGHLEVINAARRQCKEVTVIVMASSVESIPLFDRCNWVKQSIWDVNVVGVTCESPVDYESDIAWRQQVFAMKTAMAGYAGPAEIDAVFSSEPYGTRLAEMFNATPVFVDVDRKRYPISGTEIRKDLLGNWQQVPAAVRGTLGLRAIFVGAESTGTTTVSEDVYLHYVNTFSHKVQWVPEYGREYTHEKLRLANTYDMNKLVWTREDFDHISMEQRRIENGAVWFGAPLTVCDTDAFATDLWRRRYLGEDYGPTTYRGLGYGNRIYFLTDHVGVDFVQDGIRDGEHIREEMTGWFADALVRYNAPWTLLTGSRQERLLTATTVIDRMLAKTLTFNDPIQET